MTVLFLTEKSSALEALKKFGGVPAGAMAESAAGHLVTPKMPGEIKTDWDGFDPSVLPILIDDLPLKPSLDRGGKSHRDRVQRIVSAMRRADTVVIATDAGREGSLIGWELLYDMAGLGRDLSRVKRLNLTANTESGIKKALAEMKAGDGGAVRDYCAYREAQCRQLEDYLFGMNGSNLLSHFVRPAPIATPWGYGPVQLALLALLTDREKAISDHKPELYFQIAMTVEAGGHKLTLKHKPSPICKNEAEADSVRASAASWSGPLSVSAKDKRRSPPGFFSTNKLAKIAAKAFGWKPDHTEKVNQALYEKGLLTYPRVESEKLPLDQAPDAAAVLSAIARALPELAGLVPPSPVIRRKSHYVEDPGEHHAIVPTNEAPNAPLEGDEKLLYERVARGFLAAHMDDALDAVTTIRADVPHQGQSLRFDVAGRVEKQAGWRAALTLEKGAETTAGKSQDEDEELTGLPPVADGVAAQSAGAELVEQTTKPPPRISLGGLGEFAAKLIEFVEDPDLKKALIDPAKPDEPRGLGTAASLKGIVPLLFDRDWLKTVGRGKDPALQVTPIGEALIDYLRDRYPRHAHAVQRAIFENRLTEIGRASSVADCDAKMRAFVAETHAAVKEMIAALMDAPPLPVDPELLPTRAPSPAMKQAVRSTAARLGLKPGEALTSYAAAKAFLDRHASDPTPSHGQAALAADLAGRLGETLPEEILGDRKKLGVWIDEAMKRAGPKPASEAQLKHIRKAVAEGRIDPATIAGWPDAVTSKDASKAMDILFGGKAGRRSSGKKSRGRKGAGKRG
ncbi:MAG: DNA topoisomerase [Alphaproteobacteria bacterium]